MKLIFAGTPEFAAQALDAIIAAGHEVALVLTQPDRPSGRGLALRASPVKERALAAGIDVFQPPTLRDVTAQETIRAVGAEAMVVAAYGLILPQVVLDMPRFGCINIHASLLPRWRGAAPIHRAIEAGDAETGVTIMQMDAGLDTGAMLLAESTPIAAADTTATLHDRLATMGGRLIVQALDLAAGTGLTATPQPAEGVTYAHKIDKHEALIDWALPAEAIARRIRAFDPFPGASTQAQGEAIKLWSCEIDSFPRLPDAASGQILSIDDAGVRVACGQGVLRLTVLQRAGGKRLPAADFLRGFALPQGLVLGT